MVVPEDCVSRLQRAFKTTVVVQAFSVAGLLLSLVAVPLYLKWLGQERYGVLLTGLAFSGYLMFSDAGLSWSSMLLIAQASGRNDQSVIAGIVRNSFSLAACSGVIVGILVGSTALLLNSPARPAWLPQHPEAAGLIVAVGCSVASSLMLSPFYNLFIGLQEGHIAGAYQGLGRVIGTLASLVVAAWALPLGLVFGANVLCNFLAGIAAAAHCCRRHPWAFHRGARWDWPVIRQQLRTGAKSFGMQIGGVLIGTAPVLAVSSGAGPQFVPYLSIPLTLLNTPLGIVNSFNASLQAGYGEAMGRNEAIWVAETVRRTLRQLLVMLGLLSCVFFLLASPFIYQWTGGRIDLSWVMLGSALAIASSGALLAVFRFALSGINRHRTAALSELLFGGLSMALAFAVVRAFGFQWVGVGILGAALISSGWILPRELRLALSASHLWPSIPFWLRWGGSAIVVAATGAAVWSLMAGFPVLLAMIATAVTIVALYAAAIHWLLPDESKLVFRMVRRLMPRSAS